jgi:hypothetical protein
MCQVRGNFRIYNLLVTKITIDVCFSLRSDASKFDCEAVLGVGVVLQCVSVSGKSFAAELCATTGDVATFETEPEVCCQLAFRAMTETGGHFGLIGGVGELVEEEDVFAGLEVERECLDIGLSSHCLGRENCGNDFREL